jgi:group II intron reverse transcriptase/maturase
MNEHVARTVPVTLKMVVDAYRKVRQGGKAAGIDGESWKAFDKDVQGNLYVIWNRLSSGSYHPSAVRETEIPKKDGTKRKLGIPTLRDRIAQCVVKDYMEKRIDQKFHQQSYGYRPMKSSRQAIEQVRKNCIEKDWVIDLDISKYFDEIDHELLRKAVEAMIEEKWVRMYVKRWLEMKIQDKEGRQYDRQGKGTPQGGVISPLLANIFLHYAVDKWLEKNYPQISFVRYADDIVVHCDTKQQAEQILQAITGRLKEVKLRVNEKKTQIVYCKDYRRTQEYSKVQFGFLGFSYQPRKSRSQYSKGKCYTAFTAEISKENQKKIRAAIKKIVAWRNTSMEIREIALQSNSKIRGWINYFGLYGKTELRRTMMCIDYRLIKWLQARYKIIGIRKAIIKLAAIRKEYPKMFYHWEKGYSYVIKK